MTTIDLLTPDQLAAAAACGVTPERYAAALDASRDPRAYQESVREELRVRDEHPWPLQRR